VEVNTSRSYHNINIFDTVLDSLDIMLFGDMIILHFVGIYHFSVYI
jgi:hypothetical protein